MKKSSPPKIAKFAASKQRRLDQLLDRNSEGTLSLAEQARLASLVKEAEELMVLNSQRLAEFARAQSPSPPPNAVPLTVWVNPHALKQ